MDFDYSTHRWRHCPLCGNEISVREEEGVLRVFCQACRRHYYDNPICVTMAAVTRQDEEILLGLRGIPPRKGFWALPGGFMEVGETPEAAASRELAEETGIRPGEGKLLGVFAQDSPTYGTVLVAGYHFPAPPQAPAAGSDMEQVRYFSFDAMPELAFDSNEHFVRKARELLSS